ncbi:universal stress protein [Gimesia sp.]|uniref:universal stress protein n=1 Tax=Gimesia sp. TaxID=2024833 RepID=UPI0032EE63B6
MQRFKKILVGVDLSSGDHLVSDEVSPASQEAVDRAIWLAGSNSAELTFFFTLDVSAETQRMIEESNEKDSIVTTAQQVLNGLVSQAKESGIKADSEVCFGRSWRQIILKVVLDGYDIVIAGTRHLGPFKSILLGSTGVKLLRLCPSPVWITQPQSDSQIKSILVAHCLRPVGDLALELGAAMAELHGSELHVVHSQEHSEFDSWHSTFQHEERNLRTPLEVKRHIESQLAGFQLKTHPQIHIVTSTPPDIAVLSLVEKHNIELLVMGTIARTGISGLIIGNTAEKLLPQINCSVLAVKPADFDSPVTG